VQEVGGAPGSALPFISNPDELSGFLPLGQEVRNEIVKVSRLYPFRIPEFYARLMDPDDPACPIRLQSVPSILELSGYGQPDPLDEKSIVQAPLFLKRYPKRGVFLVSSQCAMYCRFCNRKRLVGKSAQSASSRDETLRHIEKDGEIREVILSGGDPLMLDSADLNDLLARLRAISHIGIIRLSTRFPVVFPMGIRQEHRAALRNNGPIWTIIHVNHPKEITQEFSEVVRMLRKDGALLLSQTVLLRGINDCHHILAQLFEGLISLGVKPYYLFQMDEVKGTSHFKVPVDAGLTIMRSLRRSVSGLCIPHYVMDVTGGLGKIPLEYNYAREGDGGNLEIENLWGRKGTYCDSKAPSRCDTCLECKKP
jgi:lysine 2,3-aminomutase